MVGPKIHHHGFRVGLKLGHGASSSRGILGCPPAGTQHYYGLRVSSVSQSVNPPHVSLQRGVVWGRQPDSHSVVLVGDLHGLAGALKEILDQTFFTGCTLVFVGDYIDRGPDGGEVLHAIRSLTANLSAYGYQQVVALRGK